MTEYEKDKVLTYKLDRKHPHWIDDADEWVCSVCGKPSAWRSRWCPCCGSEMQNGDDV